MALGTEADCATGNAFPPGFTDLQTWTRDQMLDPDWLRVGTDIVGVGALESTARQADACHPRADFRADIWERDRPIYNPETRG